MPLSPRVVTGLTLAGVILAGVPLLHLTGGGPVPAEQGGRVQEAPVDDIPVVLTVRYTGVPEAVEVYHAGKPLLSAAGDAEGVVDADVHLPESARWELEVHVRWPEGQADGAQAVSVSVTPPKQAERTETQWTLPGETGLQAVFTFTPGTP